MDKSSSLINRDNIDHLIVNQLHSQLHSHQVKFPGAELHEHVLHVQEHSGLYAAPVQTHSHTG